MPQALEQFHRDLISGARTGMAAAALRAVLCGAEPFYAGAATLRNIFYQQRIIAPQRVSRPVISVGNITTGGTGKTPLVCHLARRLASAGFCPAILQRGYKGADEQRVLRQQLPQIVIQTHPSRLEAARQVLQAHPDTGMFILDDGFQHRRICRDLDLVLIDASNPFGFGHVLPRGLLREPLAGLARADAMVITHAEMGEPASILPTLRRHNPDAPIYRCEHVQIGLRGGDGLDIAPGELRGRKVLCFCGIGNPAGFEQQLQTAGARLLGAKRFADHHHYDLPDTTLLRDAARAAGAEILITTEKDWVKLADLAPRLTDLPPIWRAQVGIRFSGDDESKLLQQIIAAIRSSPAAPSPGAAVPA